MEKQNRIPQIYGYAVCLVTVVTFLISVTELVNSVINLGDPLHAERFREAPSLASFENYKMDVLKSPQAELAYVPDDQTLSAMYEAARDDRIQSVKHRILRSIIVTSMLIILCVVFFSTHWRWMRRLAKAEA